MELLNAALDKDAANAAGEAAHPNDDGAVAMEAPWQDAADAIVDGQVMQALDLHLEVALDNALAGGGNHRILCRQALRILSGMVSTWSKACICFFVFNRLQRENLKGSRG